MRFDVLTLFPEIFQGYLGQSLLEKAIAKGLIDVQLWNFRDWTTDRHQSVDDGAARWQATAHGYSPFANGRRQRHRPIRSG